MGVGSTLVSTCCPLTFSPTHLFVAVVGIQGGRIRATTSLGQRMPKAEGQRTSHPSTYGMLREQFTTRIDPDPKYQNASKMNVDMSEIPEH